MRREVISVISGILLLLEMVLGDSYGPPKEETEVEIQKVEVYEVPWIGDQKPQNTYGLPSPFPSYGPPPAEPTTTESVGTTTIISIESGNSTKNETGKLEKLSRSEKTEGHYYIYHPRGVLQKVTYLTRQDDDEMTFSAKLKYKNVEPVKGPIYTYDPYSYVFSRLNRK